MMLVDFKLEFNFDGFGKHINNDKSEEVSEEIESDHSDLSNKGGLMAPT